MGGWQSGGIVGEIKRVGIDTKKIGLNNLRKKAKKYKQPDQTYLNRWLKIKYPFCLSYFYSHKPTTTWEF